jgi:myo-inositol-1(or 4)-monophosphatase
MPPADPGPTDADVFCDLRMLAETAARVGGRVARQYFRTDLAVRLKADRSEVSAADEAAQAAIVTCIRAQRPPDTFLAEEALGDAPGPVAGDSTNACWVIDPIDGTRNFVRGVPLYAVSVAAMIAGVPVVGAIYEPERDALYSASTGGPLLVNGAAQPARAARPAHAGQNARPLVAIPSRPTGSVARIAHDWLTRFICRNLGCTALHLAFVARGEFDALVADNPRLWDIAAGAVLISSAGKLMTSPAGAPLFPLDPGTYAGEEIPVLAARADLHRQLIER